MSPHLTSLASPDSAEPASTEAERLQARIDELAQQVLAARDAAIGAEAALGVALARTGELEHQVHVRDVEIAELRAALAEQPGARVVRAGAATGNRLARGAVRRVRGQV